MIETLFNIRNGTIEAHAIDTGILAEEINYLGKYKMSYNLLKNHMKDSSEKESLKNAAEECLVLKNLLDEIKKTKKQQINLFAMLFPLFGNEFIDILGKLKPVPNKNKKPIFIKFNLWLM